MAQYDDGNDGVTYGVFFFYHYFNDYDCHQKLFERNGRSTEFSNSENIDSTERKVFNLAPLEELLTTDVQPHQLAHELDELMFDYVQTVFYLRELRNVLLECTENS